MVEAVNECIRLHSGAPWLVLARFVFFAVDGVLLPVPTADVATHLGRKPQSLSPARDALLKKGLIYSGERGRIAFTVPHFGRYLREQTA